MTDTMRVSLPPAPCGRKNVDCQDVVKVEALDEKPVEHRCSGVLDKNVKTFAQIRLQERAKNIGKYLMDYSLTLIVLKR